MKHANFYLNSATIYKRSVIITKPNALTLSQVDVFQQRILLEQLKLIYSTSLQAIALYTVTGLVLVFMQWDGVSHQVLLVWLALVVLVVAYRYVLLRGFQRQTRTWQEATFWKKKFLGGLFLGEIVWACAGIWMMPQDYMHLSITLLVIACIIAGSVSTLSPLREAVYSFVLVVSLPVVITLFARDSTEMQLLGALAAMYFLFIGLLGKNNYKKDRHSITLRLQSGDREVALKKSQQTIFNTACILKMIAKGEAAESIFNAIAHLYESKYPGLRCSMLVLKDKKLMHGGAPSLPKAYCDAVNGLEYGPSVGSCGTSTFTGKRVLVENIETDPKWEKIKHVALPHGMRCCWSEPIKDVEGQVLGAFGMYYDHPAMPNEEELADLEAAAQLAGIVMERERRVNLLRLHSNSLEQAGEAILITDKNGVVEYINPAYVKLTGYGKEDVVGKNAYGMRSSKQSTDYYENMWKTISSGNIWVQKITEKKKNGDLYTARITIAPVKDKEDEVAHYVAFHSDLTEIEALENKFFQAQKLESVGVLVGGIAHDFNNIIAAIKGNLYLARMKTHDKEAIKNKLSKIDTLSDRAADMTKQLLTFARKDSVEMKPLVLTKFVEEAFKLASTSIPESIDSQCQVCEETLRIIGDKTQLQQLLMNLLNNAKDAVEHVAKPKVSCCVDVFEPSAQFLEKYTDIYAARLAVIIVADNGHGITREDLDNIFEPFFTTKEVGSGTGLGLAMVYGAVKRHGGAIEVESEAGQGTTFKVFFPLTKKLEIEEVPAEIALGRGEKILVVDDDQVMRETTCEVLRDLGYDVIEASDGERGLNMYEQYAKDIALILTDVVMPKVGGVELAQAVRRTNKRVPILFVTGYDKNDVAGAELKIEVSRVLNKPFEFGKLSQTIQTMINGASH